MTKQIIIQKFIDKLGEGDFVKKKTLVNIGLFGSLNGVDIAIRNGSIPSIKISPNRTLIFRESVIEYIKKSISDPSEFKEELCQR